MKIKKINLRDNHECDFIRILRNKPYVRKNSINKKLISKENHSKWLSNNKKKEIFLLKKKNRNIGYIRIENKNVSWALEKEYWGKIHFSLFLKKKTQKNNINYKCSINKNNISSQIVALKAGFKIWKKRQQFVIFEKINL